MPSLYALYQAIWRPLFAPITSGNHIFDHEWDLLIILDGCRVDTLQKVTAEFDWLESVGSTRSVGSQSKEWLAKTFVPEYQTEIQNTAYVTANIFTREVFGESRNNRRTNPANWTTVERETIGELVELWKTAWDTELDTVAPQTVTDAAITTARQTDADRLIVHYMQPHEPFIGGPRPIRNVWEQLQRGSLDIHTARTQYKENLRFVLSEVTRLLENVDAPQTVVSSDHGNAFGEWGMYGHPIGFQHPVVKNVPWAETTATDCRTSVPNWSPESAASSTDVEAQLEALGYR